MLIGEAPGAEEDKLGLPFQGAAGGKLDECLRRAGLRRKDVYISNTVKCRPPGNRDPTKEEVGACFAYLAEEIALVKPKVIVGLGAHALKALTGVDTIGKSRGRLLEPSSKVRIGDAKIIATYHPSAYFHQGRKQSILDAIVEDLKSARNVARPRRVRTVRMLLPAGYTSKELVDGLRALASARELSCDLEWLAIPNKARISWPWTPGTTQLSIALTARINGELRSLAFAWPPKRRGFRALQRFLSNRKLIFHNAMADVIWMLAAGLEPIVGGDTMLLAYLLDEQRRAGLKGLAPLVAGVEAGWEQKPWYRRPESREGWIELLTYNAGDTEATLRMHDAMVKQLMALPKERADNLWRVYTTLLLPAVTPFARMGLVGTPIDDKALRRELGIHTDLMRDAVGALSRATGLRPDVAERLANSPVQVTRYAREAFGLDVDSSQENALAPYAKQYSPLAHIKEIKHERKMTSTYLGPWDRLMRSQRDSRLHSIYLLGATRTGRLSAELEEGGSLLLTPRDDWMRDLIASPDSEYEIFSADYSQLELRVIAWLAPERNMARLFREGVDLHIATAAFLMARQTTKLSVRDFWKERDKWMAPVTKEQRQGAKGVNFGFCFGLQAENFGTYARDTYGLDFSLEESVEARAGYFELYDDLEPWHDRAANEDFRRGYTVTPFGRYRFDLTEPTKAINTPIQSTGSDLTVFANTIVDERLRAELNPRDVECVGFVHDCIIVLGKKKIRETIKEIIKESMEHPPLERVGIGEIPVPLVAEVKTGPTWAKAS